MGCTVVSSMGIFSIRIDDPAPMAASLRRIEEEMDGSRRAHRKSSSTASKFFSSTYAAPPSATDSFSPTPQATRLPPGRRNFDKNSIPISPQFK